MKLHSSCLKTLSILVASSFLLPTTAFATNGYFSHGYGIKHKGMAGAGSASSQSAVSTATNPALMQSQGNRLDFGLEYFVPKRDAVSGGTSYNGDDDSSFLIPEFGYSSKINESMSWGVVVYGNGGMNTKYPGAPYDTAGGKATGVNLEQLFISPTFSMKINEKHSFGVSLNLIQQKFEAYGLDNFAFFKADPTTGDANLSGEGEDTSTGWSIKVGWVGEVTDQLTLAVSYQNESDMEKFDKYKELFAEQGSFDIPSNWTLGLKFKATPEMNIMFDIQQINYTDVASISNANGSGTGTGVLGTDNGRGFGWDDMTIFKLGLDYQLNSDLVLRAGYSTADQPIGTDDTSFNLIAPAVIEDHLTFGATWTLANKSEISAYYMHAFENEVIGSTTGPGSSGLADIKMSQDALGIAYGWNF